MSNQQQSMAMLLLFSLLFATTASIVEGNINVQAVGFLTCTPTGLPTPGLPNRPLVGVRVNLTCDGGRTTLTTATTTETGFFNLIAANVSLVLRPSLPPVNCSVQAQLSIPGCNLLPPTGGILRLPLNLVTQTTNVIAFLLRTAGSIL